MLKHHNAAAKIITRATLCRHVDSNEMIVLQHSDYSGPTAGGHGFVSGCQNVSRIESTRFFLPFVNSDFTSPHAGQSGLGFWWHVNELRTKTDESRGKIADAHSNFLIPTSSCAVHNGAPQIGSLRT